MYVLDVAAPSGGDPAAVVDALRDRFADEGAVAVVRRDPTLGDADGAHTTVRLGGGRRRTTADSRASLTAVLDDLARDHDFALTVGFADAALPRLAVGDASVADPLARVTEAATLDPDSVLAALRETEPHESLSSLVAAAKRSADERFAGAIATFTGRVRAQENADDAPTEALSFETYAEVAAARLDDIRAALEAREGVHDVLLHHRTGRIEASEDIVFVVVLAGHRREAFRAVEDGIDRLKDEVPIFKKEVTIDEEFWRHERDA
ncbi:molybdopterin synthase [Halarchaeum nitratireducens]|uniref:Molybdopterin synthase n=1 Tax=Halarchaeum nitratireducens TaxID=489913 RepID=A0A830G7P4_9EURY|nr:MULTISPECIES: molybdopterin synthase [Halarchaeum]MBP2251207.1 molybdopterin synthase catalytic subunit [Halarchaeum solikamskense]GGN06689.1 molybdopterin synthase [Halarchaeum nitratireducens]